MLIKCPECNNQISDKAQVCIHCGFPLSMYPVSGEIKKEVSAVSTAAPVAAKVKKRRHLKLPNGMGSIRHLSGKRRKPYAAYPPTKKEEFDDNGNPPSKKALGYFKTYQDAYECLLDYSKLPYDEKYASCTISDLWEMYKQSKDYLDLRDKVSKESAYKWIEPFYDLEVRKISPQMCMDLIESITKGSATKKSVKTILSKLFDTALSLNLIVKNPVLSVSITESDPTIDRTPFSEHDIHELWRHQNEWYVKVILILLYSGMRVNELLKNDLENLHLDEKYIYVPKDLAKNKSSIRNVPLHERIIPLVKYFRDNAVANGSSKLMVKENGAVIPYNNFVSRDLPKINKLLGTDHHFHDTRHTFATQAQRLQLYELYIQKILGHAPQNELQETYTHIKIQWLIEEVNKICY